MTTATKLAFHLEMIIWDSVPRGTALSASQIQALMEKATPDQRASAYRRGLTRNPIILEDEIEEDVFEGVQNINLV